MVGWARILHPLLCNPKPHTRSREEGDTRLPAILVRSPVLAGFLGEICCMNKSKLHSEWDEVVP